jgi:hypothetical protein
MGSAIELQYAMTMLRGIQDVFILREVCSETSWKLLAKKGT